MEQVLLVSGLLLVGSVSSEVTNSTLSLSIGLLTKAGYKLPAADVREISSIGEVGCYAECMRSEECIAVNMYFSAGGDCECHLLADAAATEADLHKDTETVYMGPDFDSIIRCPEPAPEDNLFTQSHVDMASRHYVRFCVKGSQDGILGISTAPLCTGDCYAVVIGGWTNTRSVIGVKEFVGWGPYAATPDITSPERYQRFWVWWDVQDSTLTVMLGRGWQIQENVLVTATFPAPPQNLGFLSLSTYRHTKDTAFVFLE